MAVSNGHVELGSESLVCDHSHVRCGTREVDEQSRERRVSERCRLSCGFACATDDADTDGQHLQVKDTNFLTHDNVLIRHLKKNAHDKYFVILQHS